MKKILLLVVFVAVGISVEAQTSVLKTNIIDLAYKDIIVQYEKVINEKSSFQINVSPFIGASDYNGSIFGASIEYRIYITKKEVLRGFYLMAGSGGTFGNLDDVETSEQFSASTINIKANFGYQWIWNNGIILDIGVGGRYFIGVGDNPAPEFDGMKPNVNVGMGYAF